MGDIIINHLRVVIENDPEALPFLLVVLALLFLIQFLFHLMLVARVCRLEKLLKYEWPMKFVGKL